MSDSAHDNGWMSDSSSLGAGQPTAGVPWSTQDTSFGHPLINDTLYANQHFASSSASLGDASSAGVASPANAPASRTHVTTACNRCRKTKGKCNGAVPTCDQCAKRAGAHCTYPTGRDRRTRADPSYVNTLEDDLTSERERRQRLEAELASKDARLEAALRELEAFRQRDPSYARAQGTHPPPLSVATALPLQANQLQSEQSAGSSGHSPHVWSPPGAAYSLVDTYQYRDFQDEDAASQGSCSVHSASGHASPVGDFSSFAGLENRLQELELSIMAQQATQGLALSNMESMDLTSTGSSVEMQASQPLVVPGRHRSRSTSAVPEPDLLHPNRVPSYANSLTVMNALGTLCMPTDYPTAPSAPNTTPVAQFAPTNFGQDLPGAGFPQTESEYAGSIQGGAPLLRRWSTTAVRPQKAALRRVGNRFAPTMSVHAPTQDNAFGGAPPVSSSSTMSSVPAQYTHGDAATFVQHPNLSSNWGDNTASQSIDYAAAWGGLQMMPVDTTHSSQSPHDLGHTNNALQGMSSLDTMYSQGHPQNQIGGYGAGPYDPGPTSTNQTSVTGGQQLVDGGQQLADGGGVDLGPMLTFTPADAMSHGYHHRQ